jgi:thymidine kinase
MSDFDKAIKCIGNKTAINAHSEAYTLGLQMLVGLEDEVLEMEAISSECGRIGYLTQDLMMHRRAIYDKMMRYAQKQFTADQYKQFYMAF